MVSNFFFFLPLLFICCVELRFAFCPDVFEGNALVNNFIRIIFLRRTESAERVSPCRVGRNQMRIAATDMRPDYNHSQPVDGFEIFLPLRADSRTILRCPSRSFLVGSFPFIYLFIFFSGLPVTSEIVRKSVPTKSTAHIALLPRQWHYGGVPFSRSEIISPRSTPIQLTRIKIKSMLGTVYIGN